MVFDPPPRRRLIFRFIWPILIAAAVIVALVVSESGEEARSELEYLEEIGNQTSELAKAGVALEDVVGRLRRIDRVDFETVIAGIRQDLDLALAFVDEDLPVPSLIPVRSQYRVSLQNWKRGIDAFEQAVLEAADNPESIVAIDAMAESLAELRAGDNLYASLVVDMRRDDVPSPLTELPDVVISPADGSLVGRSALYIRAARANDSGLALRPGLGISQLVSDPEWQVNPSDQVVVPTTEEIVFSAVVSNVGNVSSSVETIVLTLVGGPEEVRVQQDVPPLSPDKQTAIIFDPIPVVPGGVYEVKVTLALTGEDSNPEDNERSVQFTVNEG